MKRNTLFALIALALGGVGAAQAADYSNWYIAPRVGAVFPDSDRDTDSSLLAGLGIGWWVSPNFSVDVEYTINNAEYKDNSVREGREWESAGLGVSGRWYFGEMGAGWRPYVMGGLGALRHAAISGSVHHNGWDPMATVGVGMQYNFSERTALRGELAGRYDRDNNSSGFAGLKPTNHYVDGLASVALVWTFGSGAVVTEETTRRQESTTPPPAAKSCRDLDDDRDGVNNCDDKCPGTAAGTIVGPDGCPQKVVIDLRGVNFKFDRPSAGEKNIAPTLMEPTSDSIAVLDQAIDTLKRYPDVKVEVAGHTDSIGTDEYNQRLSERRAQIVYDYLTAHGIGNDRLDGPKGYGESKPIDSNTSKEGRQRNRRTELTVENQ